jgi:hypothetical protein
LSEQQDITDAALDLKADKTNTYTKTEVDTLIEDIVDTTDVELNEKADKFTVKAAVNNFDLFESDLFTMTDSTKLLTTLAQNLPYFVYEDWAEFSYYDTKVNNLYLTTLEWEYRNEFIQSQWTPQPLIYLNCQDDCDNQK